MCGGGGSMTLALQTALIFCFTAARLVGRCWEVPVAVVAFATWSNSLFSWTPTCARHQAKVMLDVGERDVSFMEEAITFFLSSRPGDALSGWVSTLIVG